MAFEFDAEHVERLAFMPAGPRPYRAYGVNNRILFIDEHLQADVLLVLERVEVVDDFKPAHRTIHIDAEQIDHHIERKFGVTLQELAHTNDILLLHLYGQVGAEFVCRLDAFRKPGPQLIDDALGVQLLSKDQDYE